MPSAGSPQEITSLLGAWERGEAGALARLMPLVAEELRRIARNCFERQPKGHTLQPTALVNELYLRIADRQGLSWQDRAHFFGFAATTMRHILVDYARARKTEKRGGGVQILALEEALDAGPDPGIDLLALNDALVALGEIDPRRARVVELRNFAGLSLEETAHCLGISPATVGREWASARAWLFRELVQR